jgi:mannose/fructose/N-acetylgalactosamine-specific phosphotransferase system component IIB
MSEFLLWGQANPEAEADTYNGIYLNTQDMKDMISQIESHKTEGKNIPVLIEHTGEPIGQVVSAWIHDKTLQCVLELNKQTLESAIGKQLIKDGLVQELSLGYLLDIEQTDSGFGTRGKTLKEISIVKKGARDKCKILGYTHK